MIIIMNKKAFTLIELIIAVTIIGLLVSIGTVSFTNIQRASRDARRKADLKSMQTALAQFYAQNGRYPISAGWRGTCANFGAHPDTGATGYIPGLAPAFMLQLPRDPRESQASPTTNNTGETCYIYNSNGQDYKILAHHTVETGYPANDPFFDPCRPTWSWQVSSSVTSRGTNGSSPCNGF